jgi:hypothetical protein
MSDYPSSALKITFVTMPTKKYTYRVWKLGSRWAWFALGQAGVEDNQEAAMRDAREYILGTHKRLKRSDYAS